MAATAISVDDDERQRRADASMRELARRKAAARRTAWIVGAIAAALFIASLVQGHLMQ